MKTTIRSGSPVRSLASVRRLLPVFVAVFSSLASAAEPGAAEPKTHTLFMGADFSIEQNKELYRVQAVVDGAFVIKIKGKEVSVPMDRGSIKLKVEPALKLTESSAAVSNLKGERAYTLANDPTVRFQRGLAKAQLQYSDSLAAQNQANAGFHTWDPLTAVIAAAAAKDAQAPASQDPNIAAHSNPNSQANLSMAAAAGPGSRFYNKGNPLGYEGNFDAMDVAFEISSEKPLNNPYMVIIVQYRATDGRPGQVGNWIYARSLPPISREARKVHVEQGGFPLGFELQDFQVHLYNQGEEIATTVAPKRVALTREEAFQYVMVEYVSSHKGATLPAAPAMGRLPADLRSRLASGQLTQTYYVKVAKDGKATEIFSDESCAHKLEDPYLESVVKNLRFKPALEKGRPVEGVASLKLGQLPI